MRFAVSSFIIRYLMVQFIYTSLVLNGTLWKHLPEIGRSCNERLARHHPSAGSKRQKSVAVLTHAKTQFVPRWRQLVHEFAFFHPIHAIIGAKGVNDFGI